MKNISKNKKKIFKNQLTGSEICNLLTALRLINRLIG
jgi:hypothetical protein